MNNIFPFYNKSFMVNGDPNLSSLMPSANPSVPDSNDEFSKLANQLNTNSKVISNKSFIFNIKKWKKINPMK